MTQPEPAKRHWKVSARAPGEILTAAAHERGLHLGLLGVPAGYSAEEIEGWLADLIGVALETSSTDAAPRSIPALLHHGLTGLIFSHEQLWNQPGSQQPASYALVDAGSWVGVGWVGDVDVQVWVDGEPVVPEPVIVRDDLGHEACAFVVNRSHALIVRLAWPRGAEEGAAASAVAEWEGAARTPAAPQPPVAVQPSTPAPPPAAPQSIDRMEIEPTSAWFGEAGAPVELPDEEMPPHPEPELEPEPQGGSQPDFEPLELEPTFVEPEPAREPEAVFEPEPEARESIQVESTEPVAEPQPEEPWETGPVAEGSAPQTEPVEEQAPQVEPANEPVTSSAEPEPVQDATVEQAVASIDEPDAESESSDDATRPKGSALRRMFARFAFWRKDEDAADETERPAEEAVATNVSAAEDTEAHRDVPGVPDQIPPSPEPAELTERAVSDAPPIPEEPLEADEFEEAYSPFLDIAAEVMERPAQVSEPIGPPSDEPEVDDAPFEDAQPVQAASIEIDESDIPGLAPAIETTAVEEETPAPQAEQIEAAELTEPAIPSRRVPLRPEWPSADELDRPTPLWKKPAAWVTAVLALFAGGWIVGHIQQDDATSGGVEGVLKGLGLGGAHFEVMVNSRPAGAWIAVDGEDLAQRTPATIDVPPGRHDVTLSFSDLGSATYEVRGVDGDEQSIDATLWGSLNVYSSDSAVPVAVAVNGEPRGFAPTKIDSLAPGTHELRFSGPGLPSWGQTVQVRIQEATEVVARPMTSPATGLIEVRATMATATGSDPLEGAAVYVDGQRAGVTPLSLELPRGPHSVRVALGEQSSKVQVIDLPGGNQRFAHFQLGLANDAPRLRAIDPPAAVALDRASVLAVSLDQVGLTELKEMWLHVETTNGTWRRYEMMLMKAPDGVIGVTVFPNTQFDDKGLVRFYASARTHVGDEYYTEIQRAKAAAH